MRCARCGADKPPEDFPRHRSRASGRHCNCKTCHNQQVRESRARQGGSRKYHLKRRYGLTPEEFEALLARQGSLCPICLKRPAVHVDHDHRSGNVRGILCEMCNGGLGQFRDNAETIESAIRYLERHSEDES
jgi:hypothetical protein